MNDQVDIALLEKYMAGEIEGHEVLSTEGNPLTTRELDDAVRDYDDLALNIEGAVLKSQLQELHKTLDLGSSKRIYPKWLPIAAAVLLIGVFGTLVWQNNNRAPEFSEYFDHFDQVVTFRDSDSTSYSAGLEAYTQQDYDKAFNMLQKVTNPSDEIKFYQGVSALGSEQFEQAAIIFEELSLESSYKYYQQTRWYLGLAYWKSGKREKALDLLAGIPSGEFKFKESRSLIDKLKD